MFELIEYADFAFAYEVVEPDGWCTEHSSFDGHGLGVADIDGSESEEMVDMEWVDAKLEVLELRFERSFGSDEYLSVWGEEVDDLLCYGSGES